MTSAERIPARPLPCHEIFSGIKSVTRQQGWAVQIIIIFSEDIILWPSVILSFFPIFLGKLILVTSHKRERFKMYYTGWLQYFFRCNCRYYLIMVITTIFNCKQCKTLTKWIKLLKTSWLKKTLCRWYETKHLKREYRRKMEYFCQLKQISSSTKQDISYKWFDTQMKLLTSFLWI